MTGGGCKGDKLWDSFDDSGDVGGGWDSLTRGVKSWKLKMYLFHSWMSWLEGNVKRDEHLWSMPAAGECRCLWWDGVELTKALGLAPSWSQKSSGIVTAAGASAIGQWEMTAEAGRGATSTHDSSLYRQPCSRAVI